MAAVADQIVADGETFMRPATEAVTGARELLATVIRANVAFIVDHAPQVRALRQILLNGGLGDWERHLCADELVELFDRSTREESRHPKAAQDGNGKGTQWHLQGLPGGRMS